MTIGQRVLVEVLVEYEFGGRQHSAQPATWQQRAGSAIGTETFDQRLILFVALYHFAHSDFIGRPREHHAAMGATNCAYETQFGQELNDFMEMVARNHEFSRQCVGTEVNKRVC